MKVLVAGPSSVGKSTFLKSDVLQELGVSGLPTVFGYHVAQNGMPEKALAHYNILHPAYVQSDLAEVNLLWDFMGESIFASIINSKPDACFVLVTSKEELRRRMAARRHVEDTMPDARYESDRWLGILAAVDLFRVYEKLFELLDERAIPARVFVSADGQFTETDRAFVHKHLRGEGAERPTEEAVDAIAADPDCHYQSVLLPNGKRTNANGYDHLKGGRHLTFQKAFPLRLDGKSVLDIGCAIGDLLFSAERLGATRLLGIEPHPGRFGAAQKVADVLQSRAEFRSMDFVEGEIGEQFDYVFALNVLHHVRDFDRFLRKACALTKTSLILEVPTFEDPKFLEARGVSPDFARTLNLFPVIGLSSKTADQTYVYSPIVLERLVMDEIGGFRFSGREKSPIDGRIILKFHR